VGEIDKIGVATYLEEMRHIIKVGKESNKLKAIGEFGLDYDRLQFASMDLQIKYFEEQFILAEETSKYQGYAISYFIKNFHYFYI
jgi:TatD DNase family protein